MSSMFHETVISHTISKEEIELVLKDKKINSQLLESLLYTKSSLQYLRVYPKSQEFFLYDSSVGFYREFGPLLVGDQNQRISH